MAVVALALDGCGGGTLVALVSNKRRSSKSVAMMHLWHCASESTLDFAVICSIVVLNISSCCKIIVVTSS